MNKNSRRYNLWKENPHCYYYERTPTYIRPRDNFTVQGVELLLQKKWYFIRDMTSEQILVLTEMADDDVQWIDKDFVISNCDVAKEIDGLRWIWDGVWRLKNNKYFEVHFDNTDGIWVLDCDSLISKTNPRMCSKKLSEMLELGVKLFKEMQKESILNRMIDLMSISNDINNERYIEMLDFIYTDVEKRNGGLTENEITLLNEIDQKMNV